MIDKKEAPVTEAKNLTEMVTNTEGMIAEELSKVKEKEVVTAKKRVRKTLPSTDTLSPEKQAEKEQVKQDNIASEAAAENKKFFAQLNHFADASDRGGADLFIYLAKGKFTVLAEPENPNIKPSQWLYLDEKTGIWKDDRLKDGENFAVKIQEYLIEKLKTVTPQTEGDKVEKITNLIKKFNKKSFSENVIALASKGAGSLISDPLWYDNKQDFLPCENGILIDLKKCTIEQDTGGNYRLAHIEQRNIKGSDYISSTFCPFNRNATCPQWEEYLYTSLQGDTAEGKAIISFLQKFLGYCIAGNPKEDLFVINRGKGRNGKSVLITALEKVFKDLQFLSRSEMVLENKYGKQAGSATADLESIYKKRLVIFDESKKNIKLDGKEVKKLTSKNGKITGRGLYKKQEFTHDVTHVIIFNLNDMPKIEGDEDYALMQRLIIIPWKLSFVDNPKESFERKKDPDLDEKLEKEISGILNWLIIGYCRYRQEGLADIPDSMKQEKKEFATGQESIEKFLETCKADSEGTEIKTFYTEYKLFCDENFLYSLSERKFYKTMQKEYGHKIDRHSGSRYFLLITGK